MPIRGLTCSQSPPQPQPLPLSPQHQPNEQPAPEQSDLHRYPPQQQPPPLAPQQQLNEQPHEQPAQQPAQPLFQWKLAHSFYAMMGGFVAELHDETRTPSLLERRALTLLEMANHLEKIPAHAADDIKDRSKSGTFSKAFFCWQLFVFMVNCVIRPANHLPLSLLEITCLAHALCAIATLAFWWHKPHNVRRPTIVTLPPPISLSERQEHGGSITLSGLLSKPEEALRLVPRQPLAAMLASLGLAALYGLPHLAALGTEFPTLAEKRCWQVATFLIIGIPLLVTPLSISVLRLSRWASPPAEISWETPKEHPRATAAKRKLGYLLLAFFVPYVIASTFIVCESLRQLRALPPDAFVSPELICYLPHFG
ncbi:hypothetical protein AURDEDRAFT_167627 [Auricularia subglabra TFB-10046 SS5]|nr:hypothetical protein AURDEDRAFT_167627 [Auricularia subglabra TFB-10046 SS5]